jgi:hypothetical protein
MRRRQASNEKKKNKKIRPSNGDSTESRTNESLGREAPFRGGKTQKKGRKEIGKDRFPF